MTIWIPSVQIQWWPSNLGRCLAGPLAQDEIFSVSLFVLLLLRFKRAQPLDVGMAAFRSLLGRSTPDSWKTNRE